MKNQLQLKSRKINKSVYNRAIEFGFPEITARLLAARVEKFDDKLIDITKANVTPPAKLKDGKKAAKRIVEAIKEDQTMLLMVDYDVDGVCSMAVLYRSFREAFGVPDDRLIPMTGHRKNDGYGLTANVVEKILNGPKPDLIVTADLGSSDAESVSKLAAAGIDVIVTDHHLLPLEGGPKDAFAIVNPQRCDCEYDGSVAGCGVAWLLMTLVSQGLGLDFKHKNIIYHLLDFVALGTVADLVPLNSPINRYFVKTGLEFINEKQRQCWMSAVPKQASVGTLGFQIGPRINAASRVFGNPKDAIEFLTSDDPDVVKAAYKKLNDFNDQRKSVEDGMIKKAVKMYKKDALCVVAYDPEFDSGVQGIVASRLVERFNVPAVMLTDVGDGEAGVITGSCRAEKQLHIREALQSIEDTNPGFFKKFGGHKAAAGLSFKKDKLESFKEEFKKAVIRQLGEDPQPRIYETDGSLKDDLTISTHDNIQALAPFGLGFMSPAFHDTFKVVSAKMVGAKPVHMKLDLEGFDAIQFFAIDKPEDPMPVKSGDNVTVLYTTDLNVWNNQTKLQLMVKKIERV